MYFNSKADYSSAVSNSKYQSEHKVTIEKAKLPANIKVPK
jgi:hypothetical protein